MGARMGYDPIARSSSISTSRQALIPVAMAAMDFDISNIENHIALLYR